MMFDKKLDSLGLDEYRSVFSTYDISVEVLRDLSGHSHIGLRTVAHVAPEAAESERSADGAPTSRDHA
jgi:hypothetical protein